MNILKKIFGKKVLKEANYDKKNQTLTIKYKNSDKEEYIGSVTVWYKAPLMKRCITSKECELSEIYQYIQHYGNPYPKAHEKYNKK